MQLTRYLLPLAAVLVLAGCGRAAAPGKPHTGTVGVTAPPGKCWIGTFGKTEHRGCGSKSYRVTSDLIDVTAQKATAGGWSLELTLTLGGKILNQQHTTSSYGVVEVTEQQGANSTGF